MIFFRHYAILVSLAVCVYTAQVPPGTSTRPILTATEAARYTESTYLGDWSPSSISANHSDYLVGSGGYKTIQAAVNAAILAGGIVRKYIKVSTGTYNEVVYIPSTKVPLTIFGVGDAGETVISLVLTAQTTPSQYADIVNNGGSNFKPGDPAYKMYSSCLKKNGQIGTTCSAVFRVAADNVDIYHLTIENAVNSSGTSQAVALETRGDKIHIDDVRLLGHQDTFYSGSGSKPDVKRSYVKNTYIEGDIDFVFGGGTTVFEKCTFFVKSDRRQDTASVFAPSTSPSTKYGFLVTDSTITGDPEWFNSKRVNLARAWDRGIPSVADYVPGKSPNGKLVIRESTIDGIVSNSAPYRTATSGRNYSGNASNKRNLDDNKFNQFWEYDNNGSGS